MPWPLNVNDDGTSEGEPMKFKRPKYSRTLKERDSPDMSDMVYFIFRY